MKLVRKMNERKKTGYFLPKKVNLIFLIFFSERFDRVGELHLRQVLQDLQDHLP